MPNIFVTKNIKQDFVFVTKVRTDSTVVETRACARFKPSSVALNSCSLTGKVGTWLTIRLYQLIMGTSVAKVHSPKASTILKRYCSQLLNPQDQIR